MNITKISAGFLGATLILTACGGGGGSPSASLETSAAISPVAPASAEEYLSAADRLPVAVEELNRSELYFVNAAKTEGVDASTLDTGLRAVAAHATEVGFLGSELSASMAAQVDGEANAESYAGIARMGFVLALEAQHLRSSVVSNPSGAAATVAEYGARMWNPAVTVDGVTGNPFLPHVSDPSSIDEVRLLQGGDAEEVIAQAGADREMRTWIAISQSTMTRTIDLPAGTDVSVDAFNQGMMGSLTDSDGQKDHDRAVQVIGAHLDLLANDAPGGSSKNIFVPTAHAQGVAKTKKKNVSMPTGIIPLDLYNFGKENAPAIKAAGQKFVPILTKEMKGLATTAKNTAIQNTVKAAEPQLTDFLKGAGVAIPTKNKTVPVVNATAPIAITITPENAIELSAADAQKRGYNEGEKVVSFTVSWTTANTGSFTISCNGQPVGDQNTAQASLNWPMKVGQNRITCVALGSGGAILGSSAVNVNVKELQTYGSSSEVLKSLGLEVSSASAPALTTFSSSAQAVVSSTAAKSSAVFSVKPASSAKGASSADAAVSSAATVTASSKASTDTAWIEPYVKGFEADLNARKFDPTAIAIVTDDLRQCLYDEVGKGKDQSGAKSACAAYLKAQSNSSAPGDPSAQPLPVVGITATLSETITGGPKTAFATQAVLSADHKTKVVTGTITGSASWDSSYYCYNTSDSSEIYQTIGARYTSTYSAKIYAGMGPGGGFSAPIKTAGTTSVKLDGEFTHEECTHLNGTKIVDTYSGNGTISGTATTGSMWTIQNHWVTDDGAVTVDSGYTGGPGSIAY